MLQPCHERTLVAMLLPREMQIRLEDVARALGESPAELGIPPFSVMRAVTVLYPSRIIFPFSRVAIIGEQRPERAERQRMVQAGGLVLTETWAETETLGSLDALRSFLQGWVPVGYRTELAGIEDAVHVSRQPSHSSWDSWPAWLCRVTQASKTVPFLPRGPFVGEGGSFFSVTVGDTAAAWTGLDGLARRTSSSTEIEIIIRDFRARFSEISRSTEELYIRCEGSLSEPLDVHVYEEDYEGDISRLRKRIIDGRATLPISTPLKQVQVFLITPDGESLDEYSERESDRSHRYSLLLAPRPEAPFSHELTEALERGEDETTEFKEWIPVSRADPKSAELLKVVSAFSNSAGGSMFVGVSDDLEVLGINRQLFGLISADSSSDLSLHRAQYVQELRRIISEGLTPSVGAKLDWINNAGQWVLRIRVEPESRAITTLISSNEAFVRRGSSNRRLGPTELVELLGRRRAYSSVEVSS